MALTKPAGVALQIIAAMLLFVGLVVAMGGSPLPGVLLLALGGWLLYLGRQPAIKK